MTLVATSHHFWIGVGLFLAFWITASFVPHQVVILLTNSMMLVGSTVVGLVYLPTALRAIRDRANPRVQHIALGIFYAWFFSGLWRIWSLIWLTGGQDAVWVNNDMIAFFQAGIFLGACYHLTSPGAVASKRRHRALAVALVVLAGLLLGALLVYHQPDTRDLVEAIKPYLPR